MPHSDFVLQGVTTDMTEEVIEDYELFKGLVTFWTCPEWSDAMLRGGLTGQPLENLPGLPGDGGYFLHAQYLKFQHPITGEQINLEAALPSRFPLQ